MPLNKDRAHTHSTCLAMSIAVLVFSLLPVLIKCSGEGNIHLLEEDVAVVMKACVTPTEKSKDNSNANQRQRRSEDPYNHERRNAPDTKDQFYILNATEYDYGSYGAGSSGEKLVSSVPRPAAGYYNNNTEISVNRTKRSDPLLSTPDTDQCLSQCIFANLQVVDSRGIPREAELWNKVQSSVTSQQSRTALRDQIRACFQELQSEAEDNGCSYSNKLERCLMLRFSDRKVDSTQTQSTTQKT